MPLWYADWVAAKRLRKAVSFAEHESPLLWRNRVLMASEIEAEVRPILLERARIRGGA